jgi:hypothetical protein
VPWPIGSPASASDARPAVSPPAWLNSRFPTSTCVVDVGADLRFPRRGRRRRNGLSKRGCLLGMRCLQARVSVAIARPGEAGL